MGKITLKRLGRDQYISLVLDEQFGDGALIFSCHESQAIDRASRREPARNECSALDQRGACPAFITQLHLLRGRGLGRQDAEHPREVLRNPRASPLRGQRRLAGCSDGWRAREIAEVRIFVAGGADQSRRVAGDARRLMRENSGIELDERVA